jgi:potassium efflux system protein
MEESRMPNRRNALAAPRIRPRRWGGRLAALVAGIALVAVAAAPGAEPAGGGSGEPGAAADRETTEARRADAAERIAELRASAVADPERLALLERLERLLAQSLDEIAREEEIAAQLGAARRAAAQRPAEQVGHGPPYGLAEHDAALDELALAQAVLGGLEAAVREAGAAVEAAREGLEKTQRSRRAAREAADAAPASALDDLRVEVAQTELALRRRQVENARRALEAQEVQLSRLRDLVGWIEGRVVPQRQELEERLAELDAETAAVSRRREEAELQLQAARRRWERLTSRAPPGQTSEAAARAEVAARRAEFSALQKEVALLGERLDRLDRARSLVQRRFQVFASEKPDRSELIRWEDESTDALVSLAREIRLDAAAQAALAQELTALEASPATGPEREWQQRQARALRDAGAAYDANLASLREAVRREKRMLRSLEGELGSLDLAGRMRQLGSTLADVWRFEVTSSEDRSITVGRIVTGVLVFLLGLFLARGFTHWFGPRLLNRARVDEGAAHAYQSLGYYALLAIVFITALRIVDIPLTAFAVVGGALAIGVGFGSQNVVNNFISGLILLAERPIKRGDLVELEGTYGNVERIGLRSTRVRTGDNIHVIVPNSAFLENRVINWTHNDRKVRIRISVGIAYGSRTREAEKLIRRAIEEHPSVLEQPEPIVLFTEFGDNALNFEARFWVVIHSLMGRMRIESDIRFRIDDLFREAGIVIAFPQRDVHVDARDPIPVRLLDAPGAEAEPRRGGGS